MSDGICPCDRFGSRQRVPPFIGQGNNYTDGFELRMCLSAYLKWYYTNLGVELIELYVK